MKPNLDGAKNLEEGREENAEEQDGPFIPGFLAGEVATRTRTRGLQTPSTYGLRQDPIREKPLFDVGLLINGRYTVKRVLGHGGMGWVYDVIDAFHPERPVALKVMHGLARSESKLALFKAEFQIMAKLDHPNVARVYDFEVLHGESDALITMERIDGQPLHRALPAPCDWKVVVEYAVQIFRAMSYVHSRRIVHYDLKPANILIDKNNVVKVLDFGIASERPRAVGFGVMGTPAYMAPELLLGEGIADHRADLYALGITLYELLSGSVPCASNDVYEFVQRPKSQHIRLPENIGIPRWLGQIVEKLCAREPADRYPNANAVISAINALGGCHYELETATTRQSYVMTPRFSGRAREYEQVRTFLEQRLRGQIKEPVLMVRGVSGVGKSRLMRELRQHAQLQRMVFFESNCYERNPAENSPIAELLYQLVPLVEALGGTADLQKALPELVKLAPRLGRGRIYSESPKLSSIEGERARLYETTAEFFVQAAQRVPFALYINDLQWAGRGPAQLLSHLAQRIRDDERMGTPVRIALLGSYRSDEVHNTAIEETLRTIRQQALANDVELAPLGPAEISEVIRSMLGIDDVPETFLRRVAKETAGNPFFVQEVMRVLFENGAVYLDDGKWATKGDVGELGIPSSMAEVFRRRFSLFGTNEKNVLRILAVHGRPMQLGWLGEVLGSTQVAIAALSSLEDKAVVLKQEGKSITYNISHDRMRETLYADLSATERRDWHKRLAETLESWTAGRRDLEGRARKVSMPRRTFQPASKRVGWRSRRSAKNDRGGVSARCLRSWDRSSGLSDKRLFPAWTKRACRLRGRWRKDTRGCPWATPTLGEMPLRRYMP